MNVPITVQVKSDALTALKCAYDTFLSMIVKESKVYHFNNFINDSLLYASVGGLFKPTGGINSIYVCAVIIEKLSDSTCKMTINADGVRGYSAYSGLNISFMSDFMQLFGQNLQKVTS